MKNRTDFVSVGVKEQLVQAVRNQWEAARAVLWALLGLVVGLGNMMLEISPFGAALCAAVPLKNLVPAALGSAVGSLLLSGLVGGNFTIKYAAAILLIAVVRRMGREQLQRWSDYRPLVSAALAFFGLLLPTAAMLLAQPFSAYKLVLALAEATVAGACAYFLDRSLRAFSLGQGLFTLTRADFISVEKGISRINVKLRSNEETEINGQGPAIAEADIKKLYEKLDTLSDGDILVLAGSIPDVMPGSMYMDIMRYLQNKDLKIVVDATKDLLVNVLQYHPFLIKPNNHELGEIFGVKIESKADVITYAKKMQEKGARNVLVSMAGDGAVLVAEDGSIFQSEAPKGKVVNSVGAGDSMVAGFIAGYLENGSYEKAFQMGVCTGSASAFSEELATKAEVIALLDSNKKLFIGEQ